MLGTLYMKYNFLNAFFSFFCYNLLTFSLKHVFCFSKQHQSIDLLKNPDFASPYLGPKCLQRISADDKSHWKELNILLNYNNCFDILKRPFKFDLIKPLCYIFVESDFVKPV